MKKIRFGFTAVVLTTVIAFFNPFGGDYFRDPERAFWEGYSEDTFDRYTGDTIETLDTVELLKINKSTAVYFAITDSGELLVAEMKCRGNKVQFTGSYSLYTSTKDDYRPGLGIIEQKMNCFGKASRDDCIYYAIVYGKDRVDMKNYQVHELSADEFRKEVFFVYCF